MQLRINPIIAQVLDFTVRDLGFFIRSAEGITIEPSHAGPETQGNPRLLGKPDA
jgi:hypothetical protein